MTSTLCEMGRSFHRIFQLATSLSVLLALVLAISAAGYAQSAVRLSEVTKLYVDSLGTDKGAGEMRLQIIRRLRKSQNVQVVSNPKEADAVVKGTGRIWVTGRVSLSPRSHSISQPTLAGFLSAEVVGKNDETLWSYLVTPSDFPWNGITDDLANQLVTRLVAALKVNDHQGPAVADSLAQAEGTLSGGGATFPAPLYQHWFELFQEQSPRVHIRYAAVGSTEGIERLTEGKLDFAASDMPLSDQAMSQAHQHFVHVPTVLGAVVVIYNVKGFRQTLNFTPETLSGIYLGKITKWNDPQIRKSNRGTALPDANIAVVHRSDGSGTSFVWTDYLSKVSPQWKTSIGVGTTVPWPVGVGAEGNEGIASTVQQTPNSIGYVEFIFAIQHELSFGTVKNSSNEFVKASISSVTAAAAVATSTPGHDSRISITDAPGKAAYPIATFTWLLIPEQIDDKNKKNILTQFVRWALTSGQRRCSALGYAPLPADVAKRGLESFDQIQSER
jgi:phosphate transport system substrate-binding protein